MSPCFELFINVTSSLSYLHLSSFIPSIGLVFFFVSLGWFFRYIGENNIKKLID